MTVLYIGLFLKIMVLMLPIYVLVRWGIVQHHSKKDESYKFDIRRELFMGSFFLYVIGLLVLALVMDAEYGSLSSMIQTAMARIETGERINLVPFRTIFSFLGKPAIGDVFLINIVGNIIMFVPWGFCLALLWERNQNIWCVLFWSAVLPLFIETWQLFVGRSVDIDDWILNFAGSAVGGLSYLLWKWRKDLQKNKK